jgi:hypothetical protein
MTNMAQKRAIKNDRNRLRRKGIARFDILGLESDETGTG